MNCKECDLQIATKRLMEVAREGRIAGHSPKAIAKETATHRRHAEAARTWRQSDQPAWLTAKIFSEKIQTELAKASATTIGMQIGVSRQYAARIREGYRPHPRHWLALATLGGVKNA